ncbi:uncoordinated protein 58 [Lepeophtheirus salmonis]|uniref:uncoordinated protein 58 n=1 Tax=Lepeophtheirus salmonis TaxID=72036 RepID=UPI001AE4C194|nr:TWiK family of potassium channels protein 7-like [Lepeophtheirus salmonis]
MFRPYGGGSGGDRTDMVVLDRSDPPGGAVDNYEFQILEGSNESKKKTILQPRRNKAGKCYEALTSVVFNGMGIFCLLFVYILCGAAVFFSLEGGPNEFSSHNRNSEETDRGGVMSLGVQGESVHVLRQQTVEKLWKITEELNILYKENWTTLANREIIKFQEELLRVGGTAKDRIRELNDKMDSSSSSLHDSGIEDGPWTFSSAFLYSLSLITTVGSTQRSPKSFLGKLAAIFLVICGFPLLLIYLNVVGSGFARTFRRIYEKMRRCCHCRGQDSSSRDEDLSASEVSITRSNVSLAQNYCSNCSLMDGEVQRRRKRILPLGIAILIIITLYVLFGAIVFAWTEQSWTLFDGIFFSFAVLCTIGLYSGSHVEHEPIFVILCAFYLLLGLALISTVYHITLPSRLMLWNLEDR